MTQNKNDRIQKMLPTAEMIAEEMANYKDLNDYFLPGHACLPGYLAGLLST